MLLVMWTAFQSFILRHNNNNKLKRVVTVAKNGMESTGLKGDEKKCAVIHVKRGQVEQGSGDMKIADLKPIKSLDQHNTYKFLGVFENTKQEDKQVLEAAAKAYLQRLSIIWSSPLSDHGKVVASSQYGYIMVVTNQSAAKFLSTNQNRAFRPCDLCDVTMPIFGHGFTRDPME